MPHSSPLTVFEQSLMLTGTQSLHVPCPTPLSQGYACCEFSQMLSNQLPKEAETLPTFTCNI
jgi:hypothetical protein